MKKICLRVNPIVWACLISGIVVFNFISCETKQAADSAISQAKKSSVLHAKGFGFTDGDGYRILHIFNHYQKQKDTVSFLLIHPGTPVPGQYKNLPLIYTPVKRVILMSTTHVALLEVLGSLDVVAGLQDVDYLYNKKVKSMAASGQVATVGSAGNLNQEVVLSIFPDAIMAVGYPDINFSPYATIQKVGIPVIFNADWQESNLLARTEWIKVFGALLEKDSLANSYFNNEVIAYDSLKNLVAKATSKPIVITDLPIKGTWYVPSGDSYMANFIKDAGGNYHWNNQTEPGSKVIAFEDAYQSGLQADIWINTGMTKSLKQIADADIRLTDFQAFKKGTVFNNSKRWDGTGGNDYWESGMITPHVVLADLIHIFHPELLPDHKLYFYEKLE